MEIEIIKEKVADLKTGLVKKVNELKQQIADIEKQIADLEKGEREV